MAALIMVIYLAFFFFLSIAYPLEDLVDILQVSIYFGMMMPVYSAIAILFYRAYQKIDPVDLSRRAFLIVSMAWFLLAISSMFLGLIWLRYPAFDIMILVLQAVAWGLILYSMITGKVTTRAGSIEHTKEPLLYCPVCRNEIEKSWNLCPICGAPLKDDTLIYDNDTRVY